MKKFLLFSLMLFVLFFSLGTLAYATDATPESEEGVYTEALGDVPVTDEARPMPENNAEGEVDAEQTDEAADIGEGFFPALFAAYEEHRGELFSLLSAVVSLVLVFVYKKGLMPLLKGGLSLVEGQVKGLREISAKAKEENAEACEQAVALAASMQSTTDEIRTLTEALLARAENDNARDKELERMRKCILWQANLLGEVFLASSLPAFSKERVGQVVHEVQAMMLAQEEHAE